MITENELRMDLIRNPYGPRTIDGFAIRGFLASVSKNLQVVYDNTFEGIAAIESQTYNTIYINPKIVENTIINNIDILLDMFKDRDYIYFSELDAFYTQFTLGLITHEIMHRYDSISNDKVKALIEERRVVSPTRDNLCFYLVNVVEDCFIQPDAFRTFKIKDILKGIKLVEAFIQGSNAVKNFVDKNDEVMKSNNLSAKINHQLFYFILLCYNAHEKKVLNRFVNEIKEPLCWQADTIDCFENVISIVDNNERCRATIFDLYPLVERDLENLFDDSSDDQQDQGENKGEGKGNGEPQQGGESTSGDGDSEKEADSSNGSSDSNNSDKENSASAKKGNSKFEEALDKALEEALEKVSSFTDKEGESSSSGKFEDKNKLDPLKISESVSGIKKVGRAAGIVSGTLEVDSNLYSSYQKVAMTFSRLYNEVRISRTGLSSGDLDRKKIKDYVIKNDFNIFKKENAWKPAKDIDFCFMGDISGSMPRQAVYDIYNIFTVLTHGMEKAKINSSVYLFGCNGILVKDFTDKYNLNGNMSELLKVMVEAYDGGSTNLSSPLKDYLDRLILKKRVSDKNVHVLVVCTDGDPDEPEEVKSIISALEKLGVYVIGVGLSLPDSCFKRMKNLFSNFSNYQRDEYTSKLLSDLSKVAQALLRKNKI